MRYVDSVRRTPRACHGACDCLRPGRLRASHAVCLRYSTLEPALCARKEEANNESLSTSEPIIKQSLPMGSLNLSFKLDSRHSPCASASVFRTLSHILSEANKRRTMALQRTAPGRLRVSRWLLPADPPRSQRATLRRPSAVSELESLAF